MDGRFPSTITRLIQILCYLHVSNGELTYTAAKPCFVNHLSSETELADALPLRKGAANAAIKFLHGIYRHPKAEFYESHHGRTKKPRVAVQSTVTQSILRQMN